VISDLEAEALRDRPLPLLDLVVRELFDVATVHANDVVVMGTFVEFKDSRAALEVVPRDEARGLELRQHAIHGGEANVLVQLEQSPVYILRAHVAHGSARQDFEDLEARGRDLEASASQVRRFHGFFLAGGVPPLCTVGLRSRLIIPGPAR